MAMSVYFVVSALESLFLYSQSHQVHRLHHNVAPTRRFILRRSTILISVWINKLRPKMCRNNSHKCIGNPNVDFMLYYAVQCTVRSHTSIATGNCHSTRISGIKIGSCALVQCTNLSERCPIIACCTRAILSQWQPDENRQNGNLIARTNLYFMRCMWPLSLVQWNFGSSGLLLDI